MAAHGSGDAGRPGPEPLFSVVVPTSDRAHLLPRAIRSLLEQTFVDFEVVVADDASEDATPEVVAAVEDPRFRYVRQEKAGHCAARNTGAAASTGRFLAFLDDDDEALPQWLERLAALTVRPDCAVVSCGCIQIDVATGASVVRLPRDSGGAYGGFVARFDTGTFAVRRDAFEAVGGFTAAIPSGAHHELALRLLPLCRERGWRVESVPEALVRVYQLPEEERPRNFPANKYAGANWVLENRADLLGRYPETLAQYANAAGLASARLGDYPRARRLLLRALLAHPRRPVRLGRFALSLVPPLADRVWRSSAHRAGAEAASAARR